MSTRRFNLDVHEYDLLSDLLRGDSFKVVCKVLEELHETQVSKVLTYNLASGADGLVIEKARAEGSERLLSALKALKTSR
jgi:hypothetical protein